MREKLQLLTAGLTIALMTQMTASATLNLLNGDFADNGAVIIGAGETVANWTASTTNKSNCYIFSAGNHGTGDGIYGLDFRSMTNEGQMYQKLGTTVAEEEIIIVTGFFERLDVEDSTDMTIGLYTDAAGTSALAETSITLTDSWQEASVRATDVPVGTEVYFVMTYAAVVGSSQAYVDDLTLTTMQSIPPPEVSIYQAVEIKWTSVLGATYQVQYSTNLVSPNWFDFKDLIVAVGETTSEFDSTLGIDKRFYRVIVK